MHYKLFANCIPVKGYARSIICDLQRHTFDFIPNDLYDILTDPKVTTIAALKEKHHYQADDVIDEYFEMLLAREYIFFTEYPDLFPDLDLSWSYPFAVSNAIIDADQHSTHVPEALSWLEEVCCRQVQLRFFSTVAPDLISSLSIALNKRGSVIQSLQLVMPYDRHWENISFAAWYKQHPRIAGIQFYDAATDELVMPVSGNRGYTLYTTGQLQSCLDCGNIAPKNFAINIPSFTESRAFNSCLNRKISVDVRGNIKKCPSMRESLGHISKDKAPDIIASAAFHDYEQLRKDDIQVCRDCEFRYICTDCRAYVEAPGNLASKPLKCGYDPYSMEWKDWRQDTKKQETFRYYKAAQS